MRIRVNLLPHREARRERQKKTFYFLTLMSFAAGFVLVGLVWSVLQGYIGGQQDRNNFITGENRKLDVQIKEVANLRQEIDALRARQRAVEDLQADRNLPVYLMDELSKQTPEGIYLRGFKQEDRKVNITGWAASNERVSEFLRNLQSNSKYLERPELIEIKIAAQTPQGVQRRLFDFSLNFFLKPTPERAQLASQGQPARPAAAVKK
ncbi:MAG TPA: PilN domain-containing protein [Burkholderiaceae bacterium]|nr:PilN domain-containing protein [Burkholderiaceae bacterium]